MVCFGVAGLQERVLLWGLGLRDTQGVLCASVWGLIWFGLRAHIPPRKKVQAVLTGRRSRRIEQEERQQQLQEQEEEEEEEEEQQQQQQ